MRGAQFENIGGDAEPRESHSGDDNIGAKNRAIADQALEDVAKALGCTFVGTYNDWCLKQSELIQERIDAL